MHYSNSGQNDLTILILHALALCFEAAIADAAVPLDNRL